MKTTNFPSGEDYILNRAIMVVGSHADDNEIACGGTLLKYRDRGYDVVYVMATNNMSGAAVITDENGKRVDVLKEPPVEMMARRKSECAAAATMLGTTPIHLDHPQRHYNSSDGSQVKINFGSPLPEGIDVNIPSILTASEDTASVKRLADLILEKQPEIIFTHSVTQVNIEHFGTMLLVTKAYWLAVEQGFKGGLLTWREAILNLGDHNCKWDTFVDYTPYLQKKMELIHYHRCQKPDALSPDFGHNRLAKWWGSACGCGAAEVFLWINRPMHRNQFGNVYPELTLELLQNSK